MPTWSVTVAVERDGQKLSQVTMHESPLTIGSSPASHVVLSDPNVGWQHARVVVTSGRPRFLDRSLNGSFRGGERILDAALSDGDVVTIPPFSLRFTIARRLRAYDARLASARTDVPRDGRRDTLATRRVSLRRASATPSPWTLELAAGLRDAPRGTPASTFSFMAPVRVLVGRHPDADVSIHRQSVSRRHAELMMSAGGRCLLKSLTKTSWVRVNGRVIDQTRIENGDVIELGSEVTLRATLRARPQTPAPSGRAESLEASSSQPLRLQVKRSAYDRRVHVCVASGRVDAETCVEMRDALTARIDRGIRLLVVDLTDCAHVDHAGIGVLVIATAALAPLGGGLRLAGVSVGVRDELVRLGLDGQLRTFGDAESATIDLLAEREGHGDDPRTPS